MNISFVDEAFWLSDLARTQSDNKSDYLPNEVKFIKQLLQKDLPGREGNKPPFALGNLFIRIREKGNKFTQH